MISVITRHFRIRGRVQGVGFRYTTQQEARRLGLSGWVRNCSDNSVEARATGVAASLDALEQWLHHGPPGARVTQVESDIVDVNDALAAESQALDFDIVR